MNALRAYRNHVAPAALERIDFVLTHLRRIVGAFRQADELLQAGETLAAQRALALAQMLLSGMAAGQANQQDELAANFVRLYEFAAHQASLVTRDAIRSATAALTPLLEAFEAIESEARHLERTGSIPPLSNQAVVQVTA